MKMKTLAWETKAATDGNPSYADKSDGLEKEIWDLGRGTWDLESRFWDLGCGTWELGSGKWDIESGRVGSGI